METWVLIWVNWSRLDMTQILGFLLFLLIFSGICFSGSFYVLNRFLSMWNLKWNLWWWVFLITASLGYIGFSILDRMLPSFASRLLLKAAALWLGFGFLCLLPLATHDVLRLVFKFPAANSRWLVCGLIAALTIYSIFNSFLLRIKTISLNAPVDLKMVQITDLHLGSVSKRHLKRVIDRTNELDPDLVFFTGDLIDPHSSVTTQSLAVLHELKAPAYWTSGNHERYADLDNVYELLKSTPLAPLSNESVQTHGIELVGIHDSEDRRYVEKQLARMELNPDLYTVLMYHRPDELEAAGNAGVDLMLSGHTHHGQIFPFGWLVKIRFPRLYGVYEANGCTLHVSCGAGTWGPPMRLGSRNEIVLIHLKTKP